MKEIAGLGFDEAMVRRVVAMVDRAEYKRRQSPPGIKISPRASARTAGFRSPTAGPAELRSDRRREDQAPGGGEG